MHLSSMLKGCLELVQFIAGRNYNHEFPGICIEAEDLGWVELKLYQRPLGLDQHVHACQHHGLQLSFYVAQDSSPSFTASTNRVRV